MYGMELEYTLGQTGTGIESEIEYGKMTGKQRITMLSMEINLRTITKPGIDPTIETSV